MTVTIGEITNLLMPYCQRVEISCHHDIPFARAYLTQGNGFTRGYMYIVQNEDGSYSACDNDDDLHGNRFFPTGATSKPFVSEREVIDGWRAADKRVIVEPRGIVRNVNTRQFVHYLYQRLYEYGIITCSNRSMASRVSEMGFNSAKIRRTLERTFDSNKHREGTVEDLVDIVVRCHSPFSLNGLRQREMGAISAKLNEVGVSIKIVDSKIVDATLAKQIYR